MKIKERKKTMFLRDHHFVGRTYPECCIKSHLLLFVQEGSEGLLHVRKTKKCLKSNKITNTIIIRSKSPRTASEGTENHFFQKSLLFFHTSSVADPGCLSRIRLFSIPDPKSELFPHRIPDPH